MEMGLVLGVLLAVEVSHYVFEGHSFLIHFPATSNLIQKQPSCKTVCGPQEGHCEKRCEIQSGSQEMAVMVG